MKKLSLLFVLLLFAQQASADLVAEDPTLFQRIQEEGVLFPLLFSLIMLAVLAFLIFVFLRIKKKKKS